VKRARRQTIILKPPSLRISLDRLAPLAHFSRRTREASKLIQNGVARADKLVKTFKNLSRRARAGLRSAHIRLVFPVPCRSTKGRARERRETKGERSFQTAMSGTRRPMPAFRSLREPSPARVGMDRASLGYEAARSQGLRRKRPMCRRHQATSDVPHAVDFGLDRLAIRCLVRHADHAAL
jgi:hypothetical protein